MNISSGHSIPFDGLMSANVDFDLTLSNRFQSCPRIQGCLVEGCVAVDSADSEEFNARIVTCE